MKIGYARVSTIDQKLELQLAALEKYGCQKIYQEKKSAVKERPELEKMNAHLREGDVVVVWKLDRLGRSLRHLINLVNDYKESGIQLVSIQDNIDTTTAQGRLMFNLFATFAEFERELISERTKAGLKAARSKGHFAGRKPGLTPEAKKKAWAALHLSKDSKFSVSEILKQLSISKATYYRYVEWAKRDEAANKNG
jgi:DNA invertase Pin-like site-specific DNA recombinase